MKLPKLPSISYKDKEDSKRSFSALVRGFFIVVAIITLTGFLLMTIGIFAIVALFGMLFLWGFLSPAARISLGPRYMTCGKKIVYYRNIHKLEVHEQQGCILITYGSGQNLKILRENFPTKARKAEKIRLNQQAKFQKFKEKILSRVRYFAPHAQLVGLNPNE